MLHIVRAIVIMRSVLKNDFADWEYKFEHGLNCATILRCGWSALIWHRPSEADRVFKLEYDRESFLESCRASNCSYTIDVWVDGWEKVLSVKRHVAEVTVIRLKRGRWETLYFGIPSPKGKRSVYYCDAGPTDDHAPLGRSICLPPSS